MTCELEALCIEAEDPVVVGRFWAGVLGWELSEETVVTVLPDDDTGFVIRCLPSAAPKIEKNRVHPDLTSASLQQQEETVARALALGARHIDIGQGPDEGHVVLADPEGNEFCVIEAGNRFLAECGFLGALACDGSQQVGYFWTEALGWPLVWDQDQETAIRSPHGGPKITWGGPPLPRKLATNRLQLELASHGADPDADIARLISLGATRVPGEDPTRVQLLDPDGNEFAVLVRSG